MVRVKGGERLTVERKYSDTLEEVPEDVLQEIIEAERQLYRPRGYRKKPYPSNRDIIEAIRKVLRIYTSIHPDDFPSLVLEELEASGFEVRHVTVKRIWRLYEMLVRKGIMHDYLGVLA